MNKEEKLENYLEERGMGQDVVDMSGTISMMRGAVILAVNFLENNYVLKQKEEKENVSK